MRNLFDAVAAHMSMPMGISYQQTSQFGDRERFDPAGGGRGPRMSLRFAAYMEIGDGDPKHYNRVRNLIDNPGQPYRENGAPFPQPAPAAMPRGRSGRPDLVIMNTGLWELMGIDEKWDSYWKPLFAQRMIALLKRVRSSGFARHYVWMTMPAVQPVDAERKKYMQPARVRFLNALAKRLVTNAGYEIFDTYFLTHGRPDFSAGYHVGGVTMDTWKQLVIRFMCDTRLYTDDKGNGA